MITRGEARQKQCGAASSFEERETVMKRSTYRLLVQSEEKSRNILETALYGLFAISAVLTIWQFAEQPAGVPMHRTGTVLEQPSDIRIAS